MPNPDLTIVVPTFNRLDRIRRVLAAIERLDYAPDRFDVIVISDGSTDGTNEYLSQLSYGRALHSIFQTNKGPAAARNRALSEASGTFIVFIDDDVVPTTHLLTEHMKCHRETKSDLAVIGPLLTPPDFTLSPWVDWEQRMLMKQYDAMNKGLWAPTARQFYTGNASVLRERLLAAGGFDERFRRAEDVELAYRLAEAGVSFKFNMSAVGLHYAERSFRSWVDAAEAYGRNDAIFARDRKQGWLLPAVQSEFRHRQLPLRVLIKTCLAYPSLAPTALNALQLLANLSGAVGVQPVQRSVYSALFGLKYYQGLTAEIGHNVFVKPPRAEEAVRRA